VTGETQPLHGVLAVELARYLPGAFAGRELVRLGARVVRVESPDGDPMRRTAPAWDAALRAGKESVVCDLRADPAFARELCARADIVLEGFRPGVATQLGVGPGDLPASVVYCSLTGFGSHGPHASRVGHDLNYLGWAGALEDAPDASPPVPIADLAAGSLSAVVDVVAALVRRARTGDGAHIEVSLTHRSHDLVAYRLGGDPLPRILTGGLACYRAYETSDGRFLTVAALEPKFFRELCDVLGRPDLFQRQYDTDQAALTRDLAGVFAGRTLTAWLAACEGHDVCVGPVATRAEAHADLGPWPDPPPDVPLGAHTALWSEVLGS
jgi:alpha-methylacyl-CoA racemase